MSATSVHADRQGTAASPAVDGSDSSRSNGVIVNSLSVDVEDYFQVSAFERHVAREDWGRFESRVCRNTERLLDLFEGAGVQATFFVLGWVAEKFPYLVRQIGEKGHEIASHGYAHQLVYNMTPTAFAEDLQRARAALQDACGQPIHGYRAPSFSITNRSLWAFDVLIAEGYLYDASVYPIHHDRYGMPDAPRRPHRVVREGGAIWELPGSTVRWRGLNLPIGGGGYFRLLPYALTKRAIGHVNEREGQPVMFYLHPWEIDPDQPRLQSSFVSRFRHYQNLKATEPRLRRLLADFSFGPALSMLSRFRDADVTSRAAVSSAADNR